jgi:hypothetical protein
LGLKHVIAGNDFPPKIFWSHPKLPTVTLPNIELVLSLHAISPSKETAVSTKMVLNQRIFLEKVGIYDMYDGYLEKTG